MYRAVLKSEVTYYAPFSLSFAAAARLLARKSLLEVRGDLCHNFLVKSVLIIILLGGIFAMPLSADAMSYLCGDKAIRLNLNDQSVTISRFGTPHSLSSNTIPTTKIENGFEWIDKPPIRARLNLIKMELRYGYDRNGWIDTSAAQRCVRPSILKK